MSNTTYFKDTQQDIFHTLTTECDVARTNNKQHVFSIKHKEGDEEQRGVLIETKEEIE